jgi:hypothetical protein
MSHVVINAGERAYAGHKNKREHESCAPRLAAIKLHSWIRAPNGQPQWPLSTDPKANKENSSLSESRGHSKGTGCNCYSPNDGDDAAAKTEAFSKETIDVARLSLQLPPSLPHGLF